MILRRTLSNCVLRVQSAGADVMDLQIYNALPEPAKAHLRQGRGGLVRRSRTHP
jgi:hypothetical protein